MGNGDIPLVTIHCATYNHEHYIRECLNGFVIQRTTFNFEVIVHEDASTDQTASIVREFEQQYPNIIKPIYQTENQYSKRNGSVRRAMQAATKGKYVAVCEGDDYWIDPLKLQKQVDFLDANEDYGLVYTKRYLLENGQIRNKPISQKLPINGDYLSTLITKGNVVHTLTVMYRKSIYDKVEHLFINERFAMGDFPMWIAIASESKVKYLPFATAVYRVLNNSASCRSNINSRVSFIKNANIIQHFYNDKLGLGLDIDDLSLNISMIHIGYTYDDYDLILENYKLVKEANRLTPYIRLCYYSVKFTFLKTVISYLKKQFVKVRS